MLLTLLAPIGALSALVFAFVMARRVLKLPEGNDQMKKISLAVRRGANAYLRRQYLGVAVFFATLFLILLLLAFFGFLSFFVPFAFLTGGFFSGLSGFIGMKIATSANARTANAAQEGLNKGLRAAFSAGSVMGFVVVGLGLLYISLWYYFLQFWYGDPAHLILAAGQALEEAKSQAVAAAMLTFGMGASVMALFARVGGGIFTKAADVGADLVGKVEAGIPEDDPRNPAVIADNVGDNVGDVAGMGADLYESYVGSILSTGALAVAAGLGFAGITIPMVMAAVGILASIVGTFFVRTKEGATQRELLSALRRGTWISAGGCGGVPADLVWTWQQVCGVLLCRTLWSAGRYSNRIFYRVLHFRLLPSHQKSGWVFRDGGRHRYHQRALPGYAFHSAAGGDCGRFRIGELLRVGRRSIL